MPQARAARARLRVVAALSYETPHPAGGFESAAPDLLGDGVHVGPIRRQQGPLTQTASRLSGRG
jgi:hypothetical protein